MMTGAFKWRISLVSRHRPAHDIRVRKTHHEGADSRNRRPAVLSAGHSRRRRRHHRRRNRNQQAHALQSFPVERRADSGLSGAAFHPRSPSDKPPVEQILATFDRLERGFASKGFRGCPFVNAVAELGTGDQSVRKIAVAFKESRRIWFRDLLKQLDVADADGLATQLTLLVDGVDRAGSGAQRSLDGARRKEAARVLLANAGLRWRSDASAEPRATRRSTLYCRPRERE